MLQLATKWMTNSLAKKSIQNNDFIACVNEQRLYVVGYGIITSSGKNTYNVILKDSNDNVISEHQNLYLDAITKIILGASPKSKANKDTNEDEANKPKKQTSKQANKESFLLTFDEAFEIACKQMESYKPIAIELDKYDSKDAIKLAMIILKDAQIKEYARVKELKKSEELKSLRQTLDLATKQGNSMLVDAINEMIANKEKE